MEAMTRAGRLAMGSIRGIGTLDLAAAGLLSLLGAYLTSGLIPAGAAHGGLGASIGVLALTVPVAWRGPAPLAAAAALALGAIGNALVCGSIGRCGAALPAVFLVGYAVGARIERRALAGLGFLLCTVNIAVQCASDPNLNFPTTAQMVPLCLVFFAAGRLALSRTRAAAALRERSAELRAQRDRTARMAVLADRAELAENLDGRLQSGIARIAAIAASARAEVGVGVAAGAGASADLADASLALTAIETQGRALLHYLREIVGALHEAPAEPPPALADLDALLARATTAQTRLSLGGAPRTLPAGLELTAYRIVEHLLVALRDLPDAAVDVRLHYGANCLDLALSGPPAPGVDLRTVLGAARERASLHGGVIDTGSAGDTQVFSARLPLVSAHV